jgi:hypothetical protein
MTLVLGSTSLRRPLGAAVTLDEFMELSERLLGRRGLDRATGQVYLDAISADPDNAVTLAYLVQSNGNPTPEQRALSAMLIGWWYTGVYTVRGTPRFATHRGALRWTALGVTSPWFRGW